MKKIRTLNIYTDIEHSPDRAMAMRAQLIEHVLVTFLLDLKKSNEQIFLDTTAVDIINRIFGKNIGDVSEDQEDRIDLIISKLHETYPDLIYFHNHFNNEQQQSYRYPLIQYRSKKGKLLIVAFEAAVDIVEAWLSKASFKSWFSYKNVVDKQLLQEEIKPIPEAKYYRIMDWMALNSDNYNAWKNLDRFIDRIVILEKALTGQLKLILSVMGLEEVLFSDAEIVIINKIRTEHVYHHKDMVFNGIFKVALEIPPSLAIGKTVSLGYGTQKATRWQEK